MHMKVITLFIAGGIGKRLWPKSDFSCPKQFSDIFGNGQTLIDESVMRMLTISPLEDVFIVTDIRFKRFINEMKHKPPKANIVYEPFGKNTSPAINLALEIIKRKYNDEAIIIVVPCDHYIGNVPLYKKTILNGVRFCECNDSVVTIGITPHSPNTNFGYIKLGDRINNGVYKVDSFTEKPSAKIALEYLKTKKYLWNSGLFIFRLSTMMREFKNNAAHQLSLFNNLSNNELKNPNKLADTYSMLTNISIDKAIIEKCNCLYVLKGGFEWDDLGTWSSVEAHYQHDDNGNVASKPLECVFDNCSNVTVLSYNRDNIALAGVKNILVVNCEDKLLIADKGSLDAIPIFADLFKKDVD